MCKKKTNPNLLEALGHAIGKAANSSRIRILRELAVAAGRSSHNSQIREEIVILQPPFMRFLQNLTLDFTILATAGCGLQEFRQ
jgi:hypothetical protein